ncbi:MAG: hypothetical protein KGM99_14895 [Burkholderiales bacterium]|nr:hypothetical protein [Burkholderiales bacterium]
MAPLSVSCSINTFVRNGYFQPVATLLTSARVGMMICGIQPERLSLLPTTFTSM